MNKINNIIFDLDGTLWDSRKQIIKAWKKVLDKKLKIIINEETLSSVMGKSNEEFKNKFFSNIPTELADNYLDLCQKEEIKYLTVNGANIYTNSISTIKELETYIQEAGFYSNGIAKLEEEKKRSIKPFVIFGFLALLLMYLSMAPMLALPTIPLFHMMNHPIYYAFILLLLTIPFLIYGRDIIKNGIKNLYYKMPNMDTLVSIGIISSFLYSLFGVIMILSGHHDYVHHLYFESTVFVIYFIKLGRFIDQSSKEKTKDAIKKLVMITPKTAKRKTKSGIQEITIDEVQVGDILICLAGDKIAVDGVITKGETHLDEAFITGESKPIRKKEKDPVIAGSINYDGVIEYQAEKIGKESTISEIVNLVLEATNTKAPISLLADKISSYFVPIILILAIVTLFGSLLLKIPFDTSLIRFVTVLVVACPCALGLATPLAIVVSEGACAKMGILVKSSETLEIASKINTVSLIKQEP